MDQVRTPNPELRRARIAALLSISGLIAGLLIHVPGASAGPVSNGRIAYAAVVGSAPEIFTAEPDGTGVEQLTDNGVWDTEPAVSPDGKRIAFSSDREVDDDIWVMKADGTELENLTGNESGADTRPEWSPDGSRIAFMRDDAISTIKTDGSAASVSLKPGGSPTWSPDGKRIAFVRPAGGDGDLFVMNPDGTDVTRLTEGLEADSPTWSPNGNRIAFEAVDPDDDGNYHIFSVMADGSDLKQLTPPGDPQEFDPDYSPDGKKLVFTRIVVDADIVVANADGSAGVSITPPDSYEFLASWGASCDGGCTSPTESPTGSPTSTPSPTPTDTPTPDDRTATTLSLNVVKTSTKLKAAGHLDPAHPGDVVSATLAKRSFGGWKKLKTKRVVMKGDSFKVAFARPSKGRTCRIKVSFAGDADHLPSSRAKKTRC